MDGIEIKDDVIRESLIYLEISVALNKLKEVENAIEKAELLLNKHAYTDACNRAGRWLGKRG
jgi:hypothetical protein